MSAIMTSTTLQKIPARGTANALPRSFFLLLFLGIAGALTLLRPFAGTVFFATVLAIACYPWHTRLTARLGGRPRISALLLTLAILAFVWIPLIAFSAVAVREIKDGIEHLQATTGIANLSDVTPDDIRSHGKILLQKVGAFVHLNPQDIMQHAGQALEQLRDALPLAIGASASAMGRLCLALAAFFFLLIDGPRLLSVVQRLLPLSNQQALHVWKSVSGVARSSLLGAGASSCFSGAVVTAAFACANVPHPLFLGVLAVFAAFLPVAGSGIIWVPGVIYLAMSGRLVAAAAVTAGCIAGTLISGHVVKPWVVRGQSSLHIAVLLFAILGGVTLFGLVGLFAGPVIAAVAQALIEIHLGSDRAPKVVAN